MRGQAIATKRRGRYHRQEFHIEAIASHPMYQKVRVKIDWNRLKND